MLSVRPDRPKLQTAVLLAAALLAACAPADPRSDRVADVEAVDSGIYDPTRDNPLLESTSRVTAEVGTVFGLRVLLPKPADGYSYRWTFPEMKNPADGRVWREMSGGFEPEPDEPIGVYARFNHDWEAVPGSWNVAILKDGVAVLEQTFEVVAPEPPG